jgi:subtilisin family serine protease
MKRVLFWTTLLAVSVLSIAGAQEVSLAQQVDEMMLQAPYVDQEILVKFSSEVRSAEALRGVEVNAMASVSRDQGLYKIQVSGDMKQALANLLANPEVAYAEPNYIVNAFVEPNDPKYSQLWGMKKIQAASAWNTKTDAKAVIVAVSDTGVDYRHSDLKANMWTNQAELDGTTGVDDDGNGYVDDIHGMNGAANNGNPMDDHSHGTHCAGTIAATGNNNVGVVGVCWSARIMGCKFLTASGSGTTEDAIKCIDYAVANGAKVLSNSWGGGGFSEALYDSIKRAGDRGVLFVAAAGNDGSDELSYPAGYCETRNHNGREFRGLDNVLAVAASDEDDDKASFSQYSKSANSAGHLIGAPGTNILSTVLSNGYDSFNGTSMATPHVAGAATLLWAHQAKLSHVEVKRRLLASGDELTWSVGWWEQMKIKRLNINKALNAQ